MKRVAGQLAFIAMVGVVSVNVAASESGLFRMVLCNVEKLNETMINACLTYQPALAAEAAKALDAWRGRFGSTASRVRMACQDAGPRTDSAQAREARERSLSMLLERIERRAQNERDYCATSIAKIKDDPDGSERLYWQSIIEELESGAFLRNP